MYGIKLNEGRTKTTRKQSEKEKIFMLEVMILFNSYETIQ